MDRQKRGLTRLFILLLMFFLFPPAAAETAVPLVLIARYDETAHTVTVTVTATDTITLSNYDMQMEWDKSRLTLSAVENGQKQAFSIFLANLDAAGSGYGMISAICSGHESTIPAGQPFATYTFTVSEDLPPGDYPFALKVLEAANDAMERPPWRGEIVRCTLERQAVIPVSALRLNRSALTLVTGGARTLTAAVLPGDATDQTVLWTTSDPAIATVSEGTVTGKGTGTAVITAATADGEHTASCRVTVFAAESWSPPPLKLIACCQPAAGTVTVDVVTAAPVTLSNCDLALTWDRQRLDLRQIANGQGDAMAFFAANSDRDSPFCGALAAMSGGGNVALEAEQTLATYVFRVADGADPAAYCFNLEVRNAAEASGETLSWSGKGCRCTLPAAESETVAGTLGPEEETDWSYDRAAGSVTVSGPISQAEPVLIASYEENGRMRMVSRIEEDGGTAAAGQGSGTVKLFWLGTDGAPLCPCAEIKI